MRAKIILFSFVFFVSEIYAQGDTTGLSEIAPKRSLGTLSTNDENSGGFHPRIGTSLIRNALSPSATLNLHYYRNNTNKVILGIVTNFLFDREANDNFKTYPNSFLQGEFYWKTKEGKKMHKFNRAGWDGVGVAYLLIKKGPYFKGATFKFYYIKGLSKGFTFSTELIFTDNFKKFFPGFSINF